MNKGMTLFPPTEYFTKKFYVSGEGSCNIYATLLHIYACLANSLLCRRVREDKWVKRCGGKNEESVTVS